MSDILVGVIAHSNIVFLVIFSWLSIYFILVFWIFIFNYIRISIALVREKRTSDKLIKDGELIKTSIIGYHLSNGGKITEEQLDVCQIEAERDYTKGLTFLSIVSSTSPFIGLLGTVISIVNSFSSFANNNEHLSLNHLAPIISEALVATAVGMFVAIPAYSFHLILKRKSRELLYTLNISSNLVLEKK